LITHKTLSVRAILRARSPYALPMATNSLRSALCFGGPDSGEFNPRDVAVLLDSTGSKSALSFSGCLVILIPCAHLRLVQPP
jgi:hypothetical protein